MLATDPSSSVQVPRRKPRSESAKNTSDRFFCPYEGCNRSFAELWRLKVHYRASPDVRGSGKERGHGAELESCPKCGAELKPGRHHVGCAAGKQSSTAQQERKRVLKTKKSPEACLTSNPSTPVSAEAAQNEASSSSSTTAIGVPVSWLPLDFDQFFIPIGSEPAPVLMRPARRNFQDMNCMMNLVYGNYGEKPSMVTRQLGIESDFDVSNFFNDEMMPPLESFTPISETAPWIGPQGATNSSLELGQMNSTDYWNKELHPPMESSFFDHYFETFLSNSDQDGLENRQRNLSDSRKRDRGPSMEQQHKNDEKQKQKLLVPSLLNHDPDSVTSSSQTPTPPVSHDLDHSSILRNNKQRQDSLGHGDAFHLSGLDFGPSMFHGEEERGVATNQAMESLSLEDTSLFDMPLHDLFGFDFHSPKSSQETRGLKSQEEKVPH